MKCLKVLIVLIILVIVIGIALQMWSSSRQTPEERAHKEEVLDKDKVIIEEQEELTENPNAFYF